MEFGVGQTDHDDPGDVQDHCADQHGPREEPRLGCCLAAAPWAIGAWFARKRHRSQAIKPEAGGQAEPETGGQLHRRPRGPRRPRRGWRSGAFRVSIFRLCAARRAEKRPGAAAAPDGCRKTTFRRQSVMGERKTRTQGASIAALLRRLRTKYCAAQRVPVAGTSCFDSPKDAPPSSSGLGHRPFKATAGIRIPLGASFMGRRGA